MKKLLKLSKLSRSENGQVLVLAALLMTVLMGFAAFAVDIGMVTVTKSKLQNAADAAALAGAMDLTHGTAKVEETAEDIAEENGIDLAELIVSFPDGEDVENTEEDELRALLEEMNEDDIIDYAKEKSIDISLMINNEIDKNYIIEKIADKIIEKLNIMSDKEVIDYAEENNVKNDISEYLKNDNKFYEGKKTTAITTIVTKIKESLQSKSDQAIINKANSESVNMEGRLTINKAEAINKIIEESYPDAGPGPVHGSKNKVKVTITREVPYTFARILGFPGTTVEVSAVAEKGGNAVGISGLRPWALKNKYEDAMGDWVSYTYTYGLEFVLKEGGGGGSNGYYGIVAFGTQNANSGDVYKDNIRLGCDEIVKIEDVVKQGPGNVNVKNVLEDLMTKSGDTVGDYTKAKIGNSRVVLIPKIDAQTLKVIGFAAIYLKSVDNQGDITANFLYDTTWSEVQKGTHEDWGLNANAKLVE